MAKLILGKNAPTSFPLKVEVPTPNGPDEVNFTARHMRATEWAKLREAHAESGQSAVNAMFDAARAEAEKAYIVDDKKAKKAKGAAALTEEEKESAILALMKPVKDSEVARMRAEHSAALMVKILSAWDLDDAFDEAALADMCDMYPGAGEAVFRAYNETREGLRTKN